MGIILEQIETRRAKRALSGRKIEKEKVESLLEAAALAPSCSNNQPWRFLAATEEESLAKMKESLSKGNYWALPSPLIVAAVYDPEDDCNLSDSRSYGAFDLGLAVQNLLLQATHLGLIAHPIAGFDPLVVRRNFGIPDTSVVMALVVLGYPGDGSNLSAKHLALETSERERKPIGEVAFMEEWKG